MTELVFKNITVARSLGNIFIMPNGYNGLTAIYLLLSMLSQKQTNLLILNIQSVMSGNQYCIVNFHDDTSHIVISLAHLLKKNVIQ